MQLWGIQDTFYFHRVDSSTFLILCVTNKVLVPLSLQWSQATLWWVKRMLCTDAEAWAFPKVEQYTTASQAAASCHQRAEPSTEHLTEVRPACQCRALGGRLKKECSSASKSLCFTAHGCPAPCCCGARAASKGAVMKAVCSTQVGCSWAAGGGEWGTACSQGQPGTWVYEGRPYHCLIFLFCF